MPLQGSMRRLAVLGISMSAVARGVCLRSQDGRSRGCTSSLGILLPFEVEKFASAAKEDGAMT